VSYLKESAEKQRIGQMKDYVISVENLCYSYGKIIAVDNVSFNVEKGKTFSFLGPNGAGKTTTINLLITLLPIQEGKVTVAGFDVTKNQDWVRKSIGVVFQDKRIDRDLTVWESLEFHGRIYSIPKDVRRRRIDELLELVELSDRRNEYVRNLSGGMQRCVELARGLLTRPQILFLDEPTIGLDLKTRRRIWSYINAVKDEGVTIFLTTHYMDEADQNSDTVCIIDKGKIMAMGTPENLKDSLKKETIFLRTDNDDRATCLVKDMTGIESIQVSLEGLFLYLKKGLDFVPKLIERLGNEEIKIMSVSLQKPTLDDVYIHYTGRKLDGSVSDAIVSSTNV
jgi:ABC-2 type transport system ATP-binding protein